MTKKSRKKRGEDIRTPDPITKQMLNKAIKQYSGKMVRVFREVEKILGIKTRVKDDAKLLKMFKEVTPREINGIKTIKTIKTIKQSGGARCPETPNPTSFQQHFSEPQKEELSRAYENIWNPYQVKDENNAGPDGFKCTTNGWGDVGEDDIECGCKTDPMSMECLTKDNLIESPGGACYSAVEARTGRRMLDILYNGDPERGIAPNRRNPFTNAPWTAEELQWLSDVGIREVVDVVAIDRDDDVRERDFRAFEVRLNRVHFAFQVLNNSIFAALLIIIYTLLVLGFDRRYYNEGLLVQMHPGLGRFLRTFGTEEGVLHEHPQDAQIMQYGRYLLLVPLCWFGSFQLMDIEIRRMMRRANFGEIPIDRFVGRRRWVGPRDAAAAAAAGAVGLGRPPLAAPRLLADRRDDQGRRMWAAAHDAAHPMDDMGRLRPRAQPPWAARAPAEPEFDENGQPALEGEELDENGQPVLRGGGRRRKTRRKKRRKRRRRRGGQPSRMTRGVQRQAKKIHKPQKPLQASAREFVPERDGNTGYDKEVSNADEWGRNIKPYPQSHMQSGYEEIARREARRAEARRAEAREAHEVAWPTPAENAASRAKPVGGRKRRRKSRRRKRTRRKRR